MSRLPRIALNATTLLSLLLCIAVAILAAMTQTRWAGIQTIRKDRHATLTEFACCASHFIIEGIDEPTPQPGHEFIKGAAGWKFYLDPPRESEHASRVQLLLLFAQDGWDWGHLGISYASLKYPSAGATASITLIPIWYPIAVFGAAPLLRAARWQIRHWRRRRRRRRDLCLNCGYDLRATPGHCPECGIHTQDLPTAKRAG